MAILLLEGRRKKVSLNDYLLSLNPTLYCRYNETAGNIVNYGSDGNTGTVTGCTQGQVGQLGPNEAYLFDGIDDVVTFANVSIPGSVNLNSQRMCFLVKASTLGESNTGQFLTWGNLVSSYNVGFLSTNRLRVTIDLDTTNSLAITNNNQVDFLTTWALIFADYDDANELGLGRRIRIFKSTLASSTTLLTLATDTAGVGVVQHPAVELNLGNRNALDSTFDGLIDFTFMGPGLWSPAGSPLDLTVPDRIRSLVFNV